MVAIIIMFWFVFGGIMHFLAFQKYEKYKFWYVRNTNTVLKEILVDTLIFSPFIGVLLSWSYFHAWLYKKYAERRKSNGKS